MLANVLLGESYCSCVVVEAAGDLKLSDCVFSSSADMSLGDWGDVEFLECHCSLLSVLDIIACPLSGLDEIRHDTIDDIDLLSQVVELWAASRIELAWSVYPFRGRLFIHNLKWQRLTGFNLNRLQLKMAIS